METMETVERTARRAAVGAVRPRTDRAARSLPHRLGKAAFERVLSGLAHGRIRLIDGNESRVFGDENADLRAEIRVHDPAFYRDALFGGSIGAAESFMDGRWTTDDLAAVVRIVARNAATASRLEGPLSRLAGFADLAVHLARRNTRAGSRKNIAAHYDLGNEFYSLFLDDTMTYSAGVFERDDSTMREASIAKIDRACRKLALRPGDRLLEIGTGWGALAIHAAKEYGARVTTTTLSKEQHAWAKRRVEEEGVSDRVELLLRDYRDLTGRYDKLVSIEMVEAVGWEYLGDYLAKCSDLLEADGAMLLQGITIDDRKFERYKRGVDFIKRHIFPGGCLISTTDLLARLTERTDMRLFHLEDFGPHYARTLREWAARFEANLDAVRALGYDERFLRMWEFYLRYCEGGFEERTIGVVQALLVKPGNRLAPLVPRLPAGKG